MAFSSFLKDKAESGKAALNLLFQLREAGVPEDQAWQIVEQQTGWRKSNGMGLFSDIIGGIGDIVGKVAPVTALIPGVGPAIAAGATALGRVAGKLNDPGGLKGTKLFKDVLLPAGLTYGAGKFVESQGGLGNIVKNLGDGKPGFGLGDITSVAGKLLPSDNGFGIGDLAGLLGAGVGVYQGVKGAKQASEDSKRARELVEAAIKRSTEAADLQRAEFEAGAPLREAFRTAALNFADPTNPFNRLGGLGQVAARAA